MSFIIDAHAHIYPDKIAVRASASIGEFYDMPVSYDGTIDHLIELGDNAGVNMFLVQSVAVAPKNVESINDFIAKEVARKPDRFIGFGSLHPDMENAADEVERVKTMGLLGIKLHPDIQGFDIDDKIAYKIYEACEDNLPILIHTGDHRYLHSDPRRIPQILKDFPKLKLICAHFGGWSQWEEAENILAGRENIWVDTSSSMYALTADRAKELINAFGEDRIIFGSDYPMWNPADEILNIERLNLPESVKEKISYKNLSTLVGLGL